ncbi:unnamed protein product [Owenia fusiformis]|uniref:Beclin 1-associated autophagy-related key regulator n=1 Tax=Owenia fusiformis TaxID=6347 RepID=A0A8S4PGK0_OWEFU|nr:unnamed protein product [Owenia fusiformis]
MATSSSEDSSLAPTDFDLSESTDDNLCAISVAVERCPLCFTTRRPIYCHICVGNGDFTHSKLQSSQRYSDKQQSWCVMKQERLKLLERFNKEIQGHNLRDRKQTEIRCLREKLQCLKSAVDERKNKLTEGKARLKELEEQNQIRSAKTRKYKEKIQRITKYMRQTENHVEKYTERFHEMREQIGLLSCAHINDLVTYIFPIEEIQPKGQGEQDSMQMSTVSALAEARRTSYIKGRWIYLDNGGELQYSIVEPTLPGNGDYSPYTIWLTANRDSVPSADGELDQRNPHHTIGAALAFTAQFTQILSYLLDVNLPKKVQFGDFCKELSEGQFERLVFHLNHNILQLCFSQNVDSDALHYKHTVHNLLTLLKTAHLGRNGYFDVNPELMQSLEENVQSEYSDDDLTSDEDETDFGINEWEPVPTSLPEAEFVMSRTQDMLVSGTSPPAGSLLTQSTAGGLMASVASLWRAATRSDK